MITRDPIDMLLSGRMDRRAFSRTLAALGLGIAATPLGVPRALAATDASYFTWSGYELPEFHQGYIDKYGNSPSVTFFSGTTEAMHKIRAGFKTDIGHPCSGEVTMWYEAGIIAPFDTSRLTHWNDYFVALRNIDTTLTPNGDNLFACQSIELANFLAADDPIPSVDHNAHVGCADRLDQRQKFIGGVDERMDAIRAVAGVCAKVEA